MGKILGLLALIVLFVLFFLPKLIPKLFHALGRTLGDLGRAGQEIATGEEVKGSPVARYETMAGELMAENFLNHCRLSQNSRTRERISDIGSRLAACTKRRELRYRFFVLDDATPNACAIPGGHVFVTSSLLDLCGDDDDQVAGVLAHEIAHIDCRHAMASLTAKMAAKAGVRVLSVGPRVVLGQVAAGLEEILTQGYRQDQEFEADREGVHLARVAGYQPAGLAKLLEAIDRHHPRPTDPFWEIGQYFSSHPPLRERLAKLRLSA